ncbi:hypothetical protein PMG71_16900 [Roseofilum sp. BLCC_M154]|uniref:Uncharacterized protein n=1 Tax=Roseofilum acuticapitatum BLCC-M154 TaxID=3022444 RepID=A0ABT7AW71_9CYAN|nr:hypothetical protein [Roseofilum acuticapitatum]MDJ1171110.1 hypothetical protein [Roseofilum acuticapitatum BLCC-M154]
MMNTPKQVAPVERTLNVSAISGQAGVEASGIFDDVLGVAKTVAPIAAKAAVPFLTSLI